jgi:serralysin
MTDLRIPCCIDPVPPPLILPFGVQELAADAKFFWPVGSVIRVAFLDGDGAAQDAWFGCAKEWSTYANIDFALVSAAGAYDILVTFGGPWGVYWSMLGTGSRGMPHGSPSMTLGQLDRNLAIPGDAGIREFRRVALHEIGHALGCIHEHQSPGAAIPWNFATLYDWYARNVGWGRATVDAQVVQHYVGTQTQFSAWDGRSIMEYPIDKDLVLDPAFAAPWNYDLDDTDKAYISRWYPGRWTPPVVQPPPVVVQPPPPPRPVTPPVQPPPGISTTLVPDGPELPGAITPGHRVRFNLLVPMAGMFAIGTDSSIATEVRVGRLLPRPTLLKKDAGSGDDMNGRVLIRLRPGSYIVDVAHQRPVGAGLFALYCRTIGG